MCAHVEVSEIDEARAARIREAFDAFSREIRAGDIGEPQKHVEMEPMPESAPVEAPVEAPAAPIAEPIPA